jgi:hypothetical protein
MLVGNDRGHCKIRNGAAQAVESWTKPEAEWEACQLRGAEARIKMARFPERLLTPQVVIYTEATAT